MYVAVSGLGAVSQEEMAIRHKLAVDVATKTVAMANALQATLDGKFSWWDYANTGVLRWASLQEAESSLKRAKDDLLNKFLPIAQVAIMDPSRDLQEVKSSLTGYISAVEQQHKIALKTREGATFAAIIAESVNVAWTTLKKGTKEVADTVLDYAESELKKRMDPTKNYLPWVLGGGLVGLFFLYKILK